MTTAHEIIRAWCASCGMPAPSNGDVAALLSLLLPSMSVEEALGEVPLVAEKVPMDRFENAIRKVGVVAACEWFGHSPDSEFTMDTARVLAERASIGMYDDDNAALMNERDVEAMRRSGL